MTSQREQLSSRLGFILLAAGCAIGLGNVWRFPFITGQYGGAAFVGLYIFFLLAVGLPILVMEFAVGRASRQNIGKAFRTLEPAGTSWHRFGWMSVVGSYVLMMFYTTVAGWMMAYCWFTVSGQLAGLNAAQVGTFFGQTLAEPGTQVFWLTLTVLIGFYVCGVGLRRGVERVVKAMMVGLLVIMLSLVVRAVTLPGAAEGIAFYLKPNFDKVFQTGVWSVVNAAMAQAFFTLSIGIGSMSIFGSYIDKHQSLTGEAVTIVGLDTFVALMSGLIIFPACSAFGVDVNAGPGLIFVTLPNIFNTMTAGVIWGTLFFVFMSFAALSTVITVLENIISYFIDVYGWPRRKAAIVNGLLLYLLSLPCALGFNLLSSIQPMGKGSSILDLEDFIISNNLLPLGSLVFLLFCCQRYGWGWKNFLKEADTGDGITFPAWLKPYLTYVLPLIVIFVFLQGYADKFFK